VPEVDNSGTVVPSGENAPLTRSAALAEAEVKARTAAVERQAAEQAATVAIRSEIAMQVAAADALLKRRQAQYLLPVPPPGYVAVGTEQYEGRGGQSLGGSVILRVKKVQDANACKKLIKRCAMEVRMVMGAPVRSAEHLNIATQQCLRWFNENAPALRFEHKKKCYADAPALALIPTKEERAAARMYYSAQAYDAEHVVKTPHFIPLYGGPLGEILARFGLVMKSTVDFTRGHNE